MLKFGAILKKTASYIIRALMISGAAFLLFAIVLYVVVAYQINDRTVDNDDQHVRFALQLFGISNDDKVKLEHSYKLSGSWAGDYEKAFAIKLENIDESIIFQRGSAIRGDKLNSTIRETIEFLVDIKDNGQMPWFPKREQILSSQFYVYPVSMLHHDIYTDSVHIMLIRPSDNMIFYYAVKD